MATHASEDINIITQTERVCVLILFFTRIPHEALAFVGFNQSRNVLVGRQSGGSLLNPATSTFVCLHVCL